MKSFLVFLLLVGVYCSVSTAFINLEQQPESQNSLVPVQRQEFDLFANSRRLIEQLVENLRKAAKDAYDAIARFTSKIQEVAKSIRERIESSILKLRERVNNAMEDVRKRLIDSGVAIIDCIASHSSDANAIFNETLTKTTTCIDQQITEVEEQISEIRTLANNAVDFGNKALEDMKKCTGGGGTFMETGTCLGSISMQAELRAMVFATRSAYSIGRINLSIATLPSSLEICAGSPLVETGMASARVLMEIGTCSATSVFNTMTGNVDFHSNNILFK